ncbi:erythromycin esterase family protein [Saccharopolyspora sp. K220]|uniref:erythromycin esterase family protein n=1 Tax=Saccharopolyspora soli TaxID=2926618 RepID=UPI001F56C043|nr:erythromycin esterase family protein [Saccharopolyspora soli]MCI2424149.1 erythromycin esterase family protein [Saccharopolyspora soli]
MEHSATRWIKDRAIPLTAVDGYDDLVPLRDRLRDATVVALGASSRGAHELAVVASRLMRFLVVELGFRSLALEGDEVASSQLDEYARTGRGDPRELLADARPFLRTEEVLDAVEWIRAHNEQHPADQVRLAHADEAVVPGRDLADIERGLATNTIRWHERTGHKIVYWGGLAHTVNGAARTISPGVVASRNGGSYLREHFGAGYVSIGLTFHSGSPLHEVPAPPADFAEAVLATGPDAYVLDLHADAPADVRAWLEAPTRTRLIGPHYDPANDADHNLSGASLRDWFDLVVHIREVTSVRLVL